jgi:hypothetical protein
LILNVNESIVEFLVARHEVEIMRVLVKAIVQLKNHQLPMVSESSHPEESSRIIEQMNRAFSNLELATFIILPLKKGRPVD